MNSRVARNWSILFLSGSILIGGAAFTCLSANLTPAVVAIALGGSTFSVGAGCANFKELFIDQSQPVEKSEMLSLLNQLELALVELLEAIDQIK